MALSKLLSRPKAKPTAVAWAVACDLRRLVVRALVTRWPEESLTARELHHLQRAMSLLQQAENEICSMQSSLAKRSQAGGFEDPDYETARTTNG